VGQGEGRWGLWWEQAGGRGGGRGRGQGEERWGRWWEQRHGWMGGARGLLEGCTVCTLAGWEGVLVPRRGDFNIPNFL
jgi:hypothetical protein